MQVPSKEVKMHFVDSTEFSDISLEPALLTGSYTRVSKKVVDDR
jgi:hypothetical protein